MDQHETSEWLSPVNDWPLRAMIAQTGLEPGSVFILVEKPAKLDKLGFALDMLKGL